MGWWQLHCNGNIHGHGFWMYLKVDSTEFSDELNVQCEHKRGIKGHAKTFISSKWKSRVYIDWGQDYVKHWFGKMEEGIGSMRCLDWNACGTYSFRGQLQVRSHGMQGGWKLCLSSQASRSCCCQEDGVAVGAVTVLSPSAFHSDITQVRSTVFENSHFLGFSWRLQNPWCNLCWVGPSVF